MANYASVKLVQNLLYMAQVFFCSFAVYNNVIRVGYGKG